MTLRRGTHKSECYLLLFSRAKESLERAFSHFEAFRSKIYPRHDGTQAHRQAGRKVGRREMSAAECYCTRHPLCRPWRAGGCCSLFLLLSLPFLRCVLVCLCGFGTVEGLGTLRGEVEVEADMEIARRLTPLLRRLHPPPPFGGQRQQSSKWGVGLAHLWSLTPPRGQQ